MMIYPLCSLEKVTPFTYGQFWYLSHSCWYLWCKINTSLILKCDLGQMFLQVLVDSLEKNPQKPGLDVPNGNGIFTTTFTMHLRQM